MSKPVLAAIGMLLVAACQSRPPASGPQAAAAPPPMPARVAAIPLAGPGSLIGRGEADLRAAMGDPKLIRRDRNVQVWQYASRNCVLDLYIYEDGGSAMVTYVAMRDREGQPAAPACFAEIRREGAAPATS